MRPTVPRLTPRARAAQAPAGPPDEVAVPAPSPSPEPSRRPPPGARSRVRQQDAAADSDPVPSLVLVQRTQAGDPEAFGELYDRYVATIYRYLMFRVRSQQVAEDLTSETFLRAFRSIGSYSWQGRDVGAWLVTIARNLLADHVKSSRYRLELTTDDIAATGRVPVAEGADEAALAGLQTARVLDAVRRLGAEQQECVALRFLQGMSVAETAQIMHKNDGAVKALQHRALRTLGRLLREGDDG